MSTDERLAQVIGRRYATLEKPCAPPELDVAIHRAAQHALQRKPRFSLSNRHHALASVAALLLLSFTVVVLLPRPQSIPATPQVASEVLRPNEMRKQEQHTEQVAKTLLNADQSAASDLEEVVVVSKPASAPQTGIAAQRRLESASSVAEEVEKPYRRDPQNWIAQLEKLKHAGRHADYQAELQAFAHRYPAHPYLDAQAVGH